MIIDTTLDDADRLRWEQDENNARMDFTPLEKKAVADRIRDAMKGRVGSNQYQQKSGGGNISTLILEDTGKTRDIAAAAVGMSGKTYEKITKVAESGQQDVIEKMDRGEISINAAAKSQPATSPAFNFSKADTVAKPSKRAQSRQSGP